MYEMKIKSQHTTLIKYFRCLLLLVLAASCASQRTGRHYQQRNATAEVTPVVQPVPTPVVVEEPVTVAEEPVRSARPLVSQVRRAAAGTWQAAKQRALDSLCQSPIFETTQLGLYVYDLTDGEPLYAVNAAWRMRPASCQKLVTAITALQFLKGDYQLKTDFRITGNIVGHTLQGDLRVVGGMDPLVTCDELRQVAANLKQQTGIDNIAGQIVYDTSMREDTPLGWGWCWDDDFGPLSALMVDGKDCFEQEWLKALADAGIKAPSPNLSPEEEGNKLQKGSLNARGKAQGRGRTQVDAGRSVCIIHHSIDELLWPMMKDSNNIFAECLFYQTAATTGTKGAGHKQAAQRTEELMKRIGLDPAQYRVADGSGLSLYNYVSAEMLVAMLGYAWRTDAIREHLLPALPIAGVDGTLQKRMVGTEAESNVRAKTGTVMGISSLAGYLTTANGHVLAFCIINQGVDSSAMGRTFQDKVCLELCR